MNSYRLYTDTKTDHVTKAKSPAAALKTLVEMAGLELASQNGRYGKTTDGTNVSAMTVDWSRAHYSDARTTRLLPGERER